jgi:predicted dehydrogenase
MIRLGFVGCGFMGQMAHLRSYAATPDCQVVALAEGRPDLARRVAARYGIARVYPDHHAMLEAEELDGIVAPVPFSEHASLLPDLYRGCRHVLTEKPVAVGPQTGQQLAAAAGAAGCAHMVGYHKRADPAVAWAVGQIQRWRANGEAGELRYVRVILPAGDWIGGGNAGYLASDEPPTKLGTEPPPPELGEKAGAEYVSFVNYYIHQVNLLRYLLGEPDHVSHVDPKGILLVAESQSGLPAVLEMSPYQTAVAWEEEALVAFEHGYVRISLPPPLARFHPGRVEAYLDRKDGPPPRREIPTLPYVDAMAAQAARFVQVCKDEAEPLTSVSEAAEDLAVAYDYITHRFSPDLAGAQSAPA